MMTGLSFATTQKSFAFVADDIFLTICCVAFCEIQNE